MESANGLNGLPGTPANRFSFPMPRRFGGQVQTMRYMANIEEFEGKLEEEGLLFLNPRPVWRVANGGSSLNWVE